ncbi:late endosomal/lysosomal adaptor and MAPK and MTOR activator-domain-containing protein [Lasiosphaeris hirsuta]|uniref:Late endosomal/lysosomal adaptor and MAPK and MTOR activator-domain-containing protein n=1 Tax=Lasiosphaeris hirsuta TaxID=260670 RepID=A0AA40DLW6_9PEZI|nr:late endosomal/lysosomal adaptor and MAPK and MTOR activator-domain-containing protein [Lasiosphaeris hirsuta]
MGNCFSCIGHRRRDVYDEDDEAQHLFDDPNNLHYGSFDQQHMTGQEDPQEVQREIEALQRVVARTSDNMVDIYDIVHQDEAVHTATPTPYAYTAQEPHIARYQTLLSKLSSHDDLASVARVDWGVPDDGNIEMQRNAVPVKLEGSEALVGNFADAAAAMR